MQSHYIFNGDFLELEPQQNIEIHMEIEKTP